MTTQTPAVLLDLDGTLLDSVFFHVLAWSAAFEEHGYEVPQWKIHHGIGMGSGRLVPWLLGKHVEEFEALKQSHDRRFEDQADRLRPTQGALALLDDLDTREVPYLIATSASADTRKTLLKALGREDLASTASGDVDSSKPAPDLLLASCDKLGVDPGQATLIGDSPWDMEAARRIGMRGIAVRCGGFGSGRLLSAGALEVVDDPLALVGRL